MNSLELNSLEYNSYYQPYIEALGDVELMAELNRGLVVFKNLFTEISLEKLSYSYADHKWSIAEVIMHIIDAERVFQYRALRFARNDNTEIPGFDQDLYVPTSRANARSKEEMLKEFTSVRKSSISLFGSFNNEELKRIGTASKSEMSVRALGFVICGHLLHHKNSIQEKYL